MAVYVIRAGTLNLYKVGVATDVHKRLADLQVASPFHLQLVAVIKGDRADERRVHAALHEQRARGEWFQLDSQPDETALRMWSKYEPVGRVLEPLGDDIDPVGMVEIAERLTVKRATVDQWRLRSLLPAPRWTVGGRPAWDWTDIAAWAKQTGRL